MQQTINGTELYNVLQVPEIATDEQIRAAYRHLVRLHHPDANPQRREDAETQIKRIIEAYGVLGNPEKRARYDSGRRLEAIQNAEASRSSSQRAQGEPENLLGRVRWHLGFDSHEMAAKLGLADAILLDMEARDIMPTTPVQLRTFANLCRRAAAQLEQNGRGRDADDLRVALDRKMAHRTFYR